jgi:hypothetical protein
MSDDKGILFGRFFLALFSNVRFRPQFKDAAAIVNSSVCLNFMPRNAILLRDRALFCAPPKGLSLTYVGSVTPFAGAKTSV